MADIGFDWFKDHPEITQVAGRCQPTTLIHEKVGDPGQVHIFIAADRFQEDPGRMPAGAWDSLSQSPVVVTHSCELKVLDTRFPPVLTHPRSSYSENINIIPALFSSPLNDHAKLQGNVKMAIFQTWPARWHHRTSYPDVILLTRCRPRSLRLRYVELL